MKTTTVAVPRFSTAPESVWFAPLCEKFDTVTRTWSEPLPKLPPGDPETQVQEFETRLVDALCEQATPESAKWTAEKTWDLVHDRPDDDVVKKHVTEWHERLASRSGEPTAMEFSTEARTLRRKTHQTIAKITSDFEKLHLNTSIAALMELFNQLMSGVAMSATVERNGVRERLSLDGAFISQDRERAKQASDDPQPAMLPPQS